MHPRSLLLLTCLLSTGCAQQVVSSFDLPPQATILEPTHESVFDAPGISFAGSADDNDPLDTLSAVWTSDLQPDPLWVGNPDSSGYMEFTVSTLVEGTHVIELRVTDSEGQEDATTITITVTAAVDPPTVTINEPQASFQLFAGTPIDFQGVVIDSEGAPGVFNVEWASDLEGPLYTGVTTADGFTSFDTLLGGGTHLIQLRTFDDNGTTASDSVSIVVEDLEPGQLDQDGDGFCPDGIDADGDGFCVDDEVTGPDSQDCNDFAATVCPGCPEICDGYDDNNCDGVLDLEDQDNDGDGFTPCAGDCDDAAPWNFPGNPEICDGNDNDCSGLPDFDPAGEVDADGDNVRSCEDCDDNQPLNFPGNAEVCDGVDNDCNGVADDGYDSDSDGFTVCDGDCNDNQPLSFPGNAEVCDGIDNDCVGGIDNGFDQDGDGVTTCAGDCNDNQALSFPGNAEVCDGIDNDCQNGVDDGYDNDSDGWTTCAGDCNDVNPLVFPGQAELCDGFDNNCVGGVDEGFDTDGDGVTTCAGDCNDGNSAMYPGNVEICDNLDNDCDTQIDEGFDNDGDTWATCEGDCNDANPSVYPGAQEVCDYADNDCDGLTNEDQAGLYEMWETGPSSPGYQLSSLGPQLVFGTGGCSIGGFLVLQPGSASINGVFSSPGDLWDIYEFDTGLTSNLGAWLAFVASGNGLPASCTTGQISWSASAPIAVSAVIDGTPYSSSGTSGSISFNLSILQLFDVDYRITVQPLASWSNCNYTYTLNFLIP